MESDAAAIVLRMRSATSSAPFGGRLGQQHDELVAAVARGHVGRAQLRLDRRRELAQQPVARLVAVSVVHVFQVVRVDHQHACRTVVAHRLAEEPVGGDGEAARVEERGEIVGLGEQLRALQAVADVGREHGGDVGHQHDRRELRGEAGNEAQRGDIGGRAVGEEQVARGDHGGVQQRQDLSERERRGDHRQEIRVEQRAAEAGRRTTAPR